MIDYRKLASRLENLGNDPDLAGIGLLVARISSTQMRGKPYCALLSMHARFSTRNAEPPSPRRSD